MEFAIVPTLSSLLFLIILILIYNSKKYIDTIENKLFNIYIYLCLIFCITEISFIYVTLYTNLLIISKVLWNIHWLTGCMYLGVLFIYLVVVMKNIKVEKLIDLFNYDKLLRIIILVLLVIPMLVLIIPSNSVDNMIKTKEVIFSYKSINIYIILYFAFILISLYIYYFYNRKKVSKIGKFAIYITIINACIFSLVQILIVHVPFYFVMGVVMAYILYFSFANPDIAIANEIKLAHKDIEEINKTKTEFLSNLGYEINIPTDLITNLCDNISNANGFNQEEIQNDLKKIIISGNNLLEIMDNVLDISNIESGRNILNEREYKLSEFIEDICFNALIRIKTKKINFTYEIDKNISSILYGDCSKIKRIINNIIDNAIKFSEVGKVTLNISSQKNGENEKILFKISDTGNGISQEDKDKIFIKGVKLNNGVGGDSEGSGLGLSIAMDYINVLNGKIWLDSEKNVGSTFYVEVTQKIIDSTPIGEIIINKSTDNDFIDCSSKTVLIVDDSKANVKVVKRLLQKYNFSVESVLSGKECIYKVKSGTKYDIIFMDHIMDEIDGIETLHVIKNLNDYDIPPIIALTANAMNDTKDIYIKEGFDGYLAKPVNIKELDKIIRKYFN